MAGNGRAARMAAAVVGLGSGVDGVGSGGGSDGSFRLSPAESGVPFSKLKNVGV